MRITGVYNYVMIFMVAFAASLAGCNGTFGALLDKPQPSIITDTTPPVVSNRILTITDISPSSFTLSWVSALDDITPQDDLEYRVIFRQGGDASSITNPGSLPPDAVVARDWATGLTAQSLSGLVEGISYGVVVFVRDTAGNYASYEYSSAIPVDRIPPNIVAPTITLVSKDDTSTRFSWVSASDDHTSSSNLEYKIVMSQLGQVTSLSAAEALGPANILQDWSTLVASPYDHTSLQPNTTYHYNVLVRDENSNVAIYGGLSVTTDPDPGDTTQPEISSGALSIVQGSSAYRATVSWTRATDDISVQSALEYRLVGALSLIDTPAKFGSAQVLTDTGVGGDGWSADIDTLTEVPVSDGIVTHFALAVKDEAGNVSYYTPGTYDLTASRRSTLVGWWKLDGSLADSSTTGKSGDLFGTSLYSSSAVSGQAFDFSGNVNSSRYFSIIHNDMFNSLSTVMTISFWMRIAGFTQSWETIMAKDHWGFRVERYYETGRIQFTTVHQLNNPSEKTSQSWVRSADSVDDNTWHHVVCQFQSGGSAGAERIRLYIDGVLQPTLFDENESLYRSTAIYMNNDKPLRVGSKITFEAASYTGLIDDLRMYREFITADDVKALGRR